MFTESVLLALIGSGAAVGVALLVSRSMVGLISTAVDPIYLDLSIDWRFFGFTAVIAVLTAVIFGIGPALRAAHATAFAPGERGTTASASALAARRNLVSLQVAITVVLLFGALLFLRSFRNIATQDLGVETDNVVIANVFFPAATFPLAKRGVAYGDLEQRLRALPGVTHVADAFTTPIGGNFSDRAIRVDGEITGESYRNAIGVGYFGALNTPILAGRDFDVGDTPNATRVAIVNEVFAEKYLAADPLGAQFGAVNEVGVPDTIYQVVGVVRNQKYIAIREPFPPIFYPASSQEEPGLTRRYVVRSSTPATQLIPSIGRLLNETDPAITVRYARLTTQVAEALLQERLMARLAAIFGAVALLLAMVGLYGVVAYSVASRRSEIGLRVALGARRSQVLGMMLRDVGRMVAIGVIAGGVTALVAAQAIGPLLYGLEPGDPLTLAIAVSVLALAGLVAAAWPARQAAGIDPVAALREN